MPQVQEKIQELIKEYFSGAAAPLTEKHLFQLEKRIMDLCVQEDRILSEQVGTNQAKNRAQYEQASAGRQLWVKANSSEKNYEIYNKFVGTKKKMSDALYA